MSKVFYAILNTSAIMYPATDALFSVAQHCGVMGYDRMAYPPVPTDKARNLYCQSFYASAKKGDILVMLDVDHRHPRNIVSMLARTLQSSDLMQIAALAFSRDENYPRPMFFNFVPEKAVLEKGEHDLYKKLEGAEAPIERGIIISCDFVAPCASAYKWEFFHELRQKGYKEPWWRYQYYEDDPLYLPAEDNYFAQICYKAGLKHHVHTGIITPHLLWKEFDDKAWESFLTPKPKKVKHGK